MYFQFRDYFFSKKWVTHGGTFIRAASKYLCREPRKLGLKFLFSNHVYWGRYMDDIISPLNYGEAELRGFLDHLNTYDRNLQFTLEVEIENKLPFLDVLIISNTDKRDFTIYRKPTQNNRYLHFNPNHPHKSEPSRPSGLLRWIQDPLSERTRVWILVYPIIVTL